MAKVNKSKEMQGLEANYAAAWRVLRDVVRRDARMVAVVACVPGLAILPLVGAPAGTEFAVVAGLVYLGAVAVALSWYLRACLAALYPGAPGAAVPLHHYVWRVALAWAMPLVPAIWLFALVQSGIDASSGWFMAAILPSVGLIFIMFALAGVASARVAATGRFSPLGSWAVIRGRRLTSIYSLCMVLVVALAGGGFLFMPTVGLQSLGLPWWLALLPGTILAHGIILLGLSAVATAVHDRASR